MTYLRLKGLAANQGLYNGFWLRGFSLVILIENPEWSINVRIFFGCVVIAGIFGYNNSQ